MTWRAKEEKKVTMLLLAIVVVYPWVSPVMPIEVYEHNHQAKHLEQWSKHTIKDLTKPKPKKEGRPTTPPVATFLNVQPPPHFLTPRASIPLSAGVMAWRDLIKRHMGPCLLKGGTAWQRQTWRDVGAGGRLIQLFVGQHLCSEAKIAFT